MVVRFAPCLEVPERVCSILTHHDYTLATMLERYDANPQPNVSIRTHRIAFTYEAVELANMLYLFQGKTGAVVYVVNDNLRSMLEGAAADCVCGDWELKHRILRGTLPHEALIERMIGELESAICGLRKNIDALYSLSRSKRAMHSLFE